MSNVGRTLISALNSGDYHSVDQYADLSELDLKIVNHHVHELFERAIRTENYKLFHALLKISKVLVSGPEYCALRHATQQGLVDFVSDLVRIPSSNPNLVDQQGFTALHFAIKGAWSQKKALDMVRAIVLIPKIKLNLRARDSRTALHMAMEKQWFEVAATLVAAGAHPKIEDKNGNTALSMALPHFGELPGDLFGRMIAFNDDLPEEETPEMSSPERIDEAEATPPTQKPSVPHQQDSGHLLHLHGKQQHTDSNRSQSAKETPSNHRDYIQESDISSIKPASQNGQDTATLADVMGDQNLDDTLVKSFLFEANQDLPRFRLHRAALQNHIQEIWQALQLSGQSFSLEDARRTDPDSGQNLWHAAAQAGKMGEWLTYFANNGLSPEPEDLTSRGHDGLSVAECLESNGRIQEILNNSFLDKHPRLRLALLAGLPEKKRKGFSLDISKAHLLLLES